MSCPVSFNTAFHSCVEECSVDDGHWKYSSIIKCVCWSRDLVQWSLWMIKGCWSTLELVYYTPRVVCFKITHAERMNAAWCLDESHHPMKQSGQSTLLFSDFCACSQASRVAEGQNCASQLPAWGWPLDWDLGYLGRTLISVCSVVWINGFPFTHHCLLSSTFVCRKPEHWAAKSLLFVGLDTMGPCEEPGELTLGFAAPGPAVACWRHVPVWDTCAGHNSSMLRVLLAYGARQVERGFRRKGEAVALPLPRSHTWPHS